MPHATSILTWTRSQTKQALGLLNKEPQFWLPVDTSSTSSNFNLLSVIATRARCSRCCAVLYEAKRVQEITQKAACHSPVVGVLLFSFYLLYDTQIIIGGKHRRYQIEEDSYVLASVALYLDIINMFLYILELLNGEWKWVFWVVNKLNLDLKSLGIR